MVEGKMNLLRPRYVAVAVAAYFAIVAYLAWETARRTTGPWYDSAASKVVYQTSLVGGILLLAGIFVVASLVPRLPVAARQGRRASSKLARGGPSSSDVEASGEADRAANETNDANWDDVEAFLDDLPEARRSGEVGEIRIQDTDPSAAPSARSLPFDGSSSAGTLTDRLTEIRARSTVVVYPEGKDTARVLSGLVAEMRPLLRAARRVGLDGREIRRMVGEPLGSQDTDLAQRVRLVEHVKDTLEAALVERIGEDLQDVLIGIQRVNDAAGLARAAELTAAEAVTLLDTGNYLVAIDRVERAREKIRARSGAAEALRTKASGRSSWVALAGPAIGSVAYVAISSMLLPGYAGFVQANYQLNTTAILVLSYGWAGLLLYALTSVYMTLRPAPE